MIIWAVEISQTKPFWKTLKKLVLLTLRWKDKAFTPTWDITCSIQFLHLVPTLNYCFRKYHNILINSEQIWSLKKKISLKITLKNLNQIKGTELGAVLGTTISMSSVRVLMRNVIKSRNADNSGSSASSSYFLLNAQMQPCTPFFHSFPPILNEITTE